MLARRRDESDLGNTTPGGTNPTIIYKIDGSMVKKNPSPSAAPGHQFKLRQGN